MPTLTGRDVIFTNMASGLGMDTPTNTLSGVAGTAAAAGSGFLSAGLSTNTIGTTYPATLVGIQLPPGLTAALRLVLAQSASNQALPNFLAYFYNMGTVDLANAAATPYDGFTADAGVTYPLLRTKYTATSQAITLIPMCYITTDTATTAPVFDLQTAAGAAGYVDQDGNSTVGTATMTMPAAATVAQSGYIIRLQPGDTGVRSISAVRVTTKGTAGAARIFGVEILAGITIPSTSWTQLDDLAFSGLALPDLRPATPTAGTLTSYLGVLRLNVTTSGQTIRLLAVLD